MYFDRDNFRNGFELLFLCCHEKDGTRHQIIDVYADAVQKRRRMPIALDTVVSRCRGLRKFIYFLPVKWLEQWTTIQIENFT